MQMRTHSNVENGVIPDEAKLAARQTFGDFDQVKGSCEIKRGSPLDLKRLRMGLYIAIGCIAGSVSLWAVNVPHNNVFSVLWQLIAIAVLMRSFLIGRKRNNPHID